jgi:4-hydroxymandelate oxidase
MKEVRDQARKQMEGFCRVCPVCDGRACAGQVPGMGGIGTGAAFRDNVQALAEYGFQMRVIHDVVEPETRINFLGFSMDIPVLAAPIGGVSFNMGGKISEEVYIAAKLEGCKEKGIVGMAFPLSNLGKTRNCSENLKPLQMPELPLSAWISMLPA